MANTAGSSTFNDLPQELLDVIIDFVPQNPPLRNFALVGKRWVRRCQERLFEQLTLSSQETTRPVLKNQPLLFSYVRTLTLKRVYPPQWKDANFERHISCFGGCSDSPGQVDKQKPCRVHTLKLMACSVDLDGEILSRVLGPLRTSVRTVVMGSVSIPPVMDVRPFLCMFSQLRNVYIPGPQFSSVVPGEGSTLAKELTMPPLNGELELLFLYHGLEGVLSSLSKLPLQFRSITVSPPNEHFDPEITDILVTCGETIKTFRVKRMKLDVQVLRPITLSPCTRLEEIRLDLRDTRDPGPGTIHLFDSVTSPHLSRIVFHFVVPLNSRKIDSSLYSTDWTRLDESLHRLAARLRIIHESQSLEIHATPSWTETEPRQRKEVEKLKVFIEARFLFVQLTAEQVNLGSFLSKFREVGDVVFVPQKIRTLNEDGAGSSSTSSKF